MFKNTYNNRSFLPIVNTSSQLVFNLANYILLISLSEPETAKNALLLFSLASLFRVLDLGLITGIVPFLKNRAMGQEFTSSILIFISILISFLLVLCLLYINLVDNSRDTKFAISLGILLLTHSLLNALMDGCFLLHFRCMTNAFFYLVTTLILLMSTIFNVYDSTTFTSAYLLISVFCSVVFVIRIISFTSLKTITIRKLYQVFQFIIKYWYLSISSVIYEPLFRLCFGSVFSATQFIQIDIINQIVVRAKIIPGTLQGSYLALGRLSPITDVSKNSKIVGLQSLYFSTLYILSVIIALCITWLNVDEQLIINKYVASIAIISHGLHVAAMPYYNHLLVRKREAVLSVLNSIIYLPIIMVWLPHTLNLPIYEDISYTLSCLSFLILGLAQYKYFRRIRYEL